MTERKNGSATKVALKMTSGVLHLLITVIFYVLIIMVIVRLATASYQFAYQVVGNVTVEEAPGRDVDIVIEEGESTMNIASKLALNKVVVNKYTFFVRAMLNRKSPIVPGTYTLNTSMTYDEVLGVITGKSDS